MAERIDIGGLENDPALRAVGRLPQSIEPARDLWPTIARGLDTPASGGRRFGVLTGWYAAAAAIGCMALGGLLTYAMLGRQKTVVEFRPTTTVAVAPAARNGQATFGYAALGPDYERARAQLAIGLAERMDRLPPVARLKVERNLNEIHRALAEINAALELSPNSTLLQQLLLSTYQDELNLLANVNQMAGSLPARTQS